MPRGYLIASNRWAAPSTIGRKEIDLTTNNEWSELAWHKVADRLQLQTFLLARKQTQGTAFVVAQGTAKNSSSHFYALATAWHCIDGLMQEDEIILLREIDNLNVHGKVANLATARLGDDSFDLGLIFLRLPEVLVAADQMMPVRGFGNHPVLGDDLCWLGHPAGLTTQPVFCRGTLAAFQREPLCYLLNGCAYPGMSGSAVADKKGHIVGLVSEYWTSPSAPTAPGLLKVAPSQMVRHVLEDRMGAKILEELPKGDQPQG